MGKGAGAHTEPCTRLTWSSRKGLPSHHRPLKAGVLTLCGPRGLLSPITTPRLPALPLNGSNTAAPPAVQAGLPSLATKQEGPRMPFSWDQARNARFCPPDTRASWKRLRSLRLETRLVVLFWFGLLSPQPQLHLSPPPLSFYILQVKESM